MDKGWTAEDLGWTEGGPERVLLMRDGPERAWITLGLTRDGKERF